MGDNDPASDIRFNNVSQVLEYSTRQSWVPIPGTSGTPIPSSSSSIPTLTAKDLSNLKAPEGTLIYNSTTHKLNVKTLKAWEEITSI